MQTAPPPLPIHHRSSDLDPLVRGDAWREIAHRWVDFRPEPGVPLEAEFSVLPGSACLFGATRSSAYEMRTGPRRSAQPDDMVVLTLLQSGELLPHDYPRKGPGALSLCAPRQMGRYRWGQGASQVFLCLPHSEVRSALGREPDTQLLTARCALAAPLAAQMDHVALLLRQHQRIDATENAGLLDATRALALLMLRNLGRQGDAVDQPDPHESLHAGRRAAALRFMEQNAHRSDLHVAAIARGAGCSRTRLYDAFAAQGRTVMDTLREIRLQRARLLIDHNQRLQVGVVAWRCGFADLSGFGKQFKARFGCTPSEWRWKLRAQ